ncbi:MAG: DUF559 domain-containing protein, partial [Solirubrobacteraceae bacterium]
MLDSNDMPASASRCGVYPSAGSKRPTGDAENAPRDVDRLPDGKQPTTIAARVERDVCCPPDGKQPNPGEASREWAVRRIIGWPDDAVADLAGSQYGLVTRSQLHELGLGRAAVDHALERGRLRSVHRGVYAVGHVALPPLAPYMAAALAVGPGAVVSHGSAAALWGIRSGAKGPVELTLAGRDAGRRRDGLIVHRCHALDVADQGSLRGIPVTAAARALLDITPGLTDRELERAFDAALKAQLVAPVDVEAAVARAPGRPGAARLSALARLELGSGDTRSDGEERLIALVRAGGLPEPETNVPIGPYIVDALWRRERLIVEVDSHRFHGTRRSFEADRERDLFLAAAGYEVMRITWTQLYTRPEQVLVRLTQRLATAASAQS